MGLIKIIFKIMFRFIEKSIDYFSNIYSNFLLWVCGFEYNSNIKFKGVPNIRKSLNSSIKIGASCKFNSSYKSNLIGVNRPYILPTANKAILSIDTGSGLSRSVIGCFDKIIMGKNIKIGLNLLITDLVWYSSDTRSAEPKPFNIGDNVWVGEEVKILEGVNIGKNSLIGASSVVTKSIPENIIATRNLCQVDKPIKLNE